MRRNEEEWASPNTSPSVKNLWEQARSPQGNCGQAGAISVMTLPLSIRTN